MSLNRSLLQVWLVSMICLILLVMGSESSFAAPCTCSWSEIKACFDPNPPRCCECTKNFEDLYYYYLYYLGGDPSISPVDILTGKYRSAYETWSLGLSKQAPIGNATWGAIKNLFPTK
jgi:hypothetical protein